MSKNKKYSSGKNKLINPKIITLLITTSAISIVIGFSLGRLSMPSKPYSDSLQTTDPSPIPTLQPSPTPTVTIKSDTKPITGPSPTMFVSKTKWKIYNNDKFTIQYPASYKVECSEPQAPCEGEDVSTSNKITFIPPEDKGNGQITIEKEGILHPSRQLNEPLEKYLNRLLGSTLRISSKPTVINNLEALKTIDGEFDNKRKISTYIFENNTLFKIQFSDPNANLFNQDKPITDYPNIDIYEQILSTFTLKDAPNPTPQPIPSITNALDLP